MRHPGGHASRSQTHWDGIYTRNGRSRDSPLRASPEGRRAAANADVDE